MSIGNRSKAQVMAELSELLAEVFHMRANGVPYAKLQRAHGYADGYMRVLLDSGMVTRQELLRLVSQERERVSGPATGVVGTVAAA